MTVDATGYFGSITKAALIAKYKLMGSLGQQVGLEWEAHLRILCYPHFQNTFGLSTIDLLNDVTPPA
jgi:peptidoglycan L-alanyl-D-glutamate endopeptidase CwlK